MSRIDIKATTTDGYRVFRERTDTHTRMGVSCPGVEDGAYCAVVDVPEGDATFDLTAMGHRAQQAITAMRSLGGCPLHQPTALDTALDGLSAAQLTALLLPPAG